MLFRSPRLLRRESDARPGLPPPRASRPGSRVLRRRSPGPGRSGVRETAQREKSWSGRVGKEGSSPAPLGASATRRGRTEQSREHNSPRLAHPPQRAPAAPEPEAGPSLVPAHAAPHSQSPQRRLLARAVPPLTFLRRLCPAPLACPRPSGLQANGSSPLLHKRAGAGPKTETAGPTPAPLLPARSLGVVSARPPALAVCDLRSTGGCWPSGSAVTLSCFTHPAWPLPRRPRFSLASREPCTALAGAAGESRPGPRVAAARP